MAMSIFPKSSKFYDLFIFQNELLIRASDILYDIFKNFENVEDKCSLITELEIEGDKVYRNISKQLSAKLITPINRDDIFAINIAQENLMNYFKGISTRIGLYKFDELKAASLDLIGYLHDMTAETGKMMKNLSSKKEIETMFDQIIKIKGYADLILIAAIGEIYETNIDEKNQVLDIIKWTQIYDRIEQAILGAEILGNLIEAAGLKNS